MTAPSPYAMLHIEHVAPSPSNPRKHFDPSALDELAATIADHGVIEPIIVRLWPDDYDAPARAPDMTTAPLYEIVAGERRYRASLIAKQTEIPALVRHLTTRQVLEIQIIENLQRRGVNELEEAEGYQLMMQDYGYTADELAAKVGKSRAYIYGRLKLCALCEPARQAYRDGDLSASTALLIARIPGEAMQTRAVEEITKGWRGILSYREAAQHVQTRFMVRLNSVAFDLCDASLVPGAGACTDCPKRPINAPLLFPDIPPENAADVCTDPDCLKAKSDAYQQRRVEDAEALGMSVVRGLDWTAYVREFSRLDAEDETQPPIYINEAGEDIPNPSSEDEENCDYRHPTHREMLERTGQQVDIVLIEHPGSRELIEAVLTEDYRTRIPLVTDGSPSDDHWEAKKAKAIAEKAYRIDLVTCIHDTLSARQALPDADNLRMMAYPLWGRVYGPGRDLLCKLFVPDAPQAERVTALTAKIADMDVCELTLFNVAAAFAPMVDVNEYLPELATTPVQLLDYARCIGIDPANPVAPEPDESASTPKQAAPAADESAGKAKTAYAHPDNADLTWTGRGRKPKWVEEYLANGGDLKDLYTADQAAQARETSAPDKPKAKAAAAARKAKEKASDGGRAAAGGKNKTIACSTADAPAVRCDRTMDLIDQNFPELATSAATAGAAETLS